MDELKSILPAEAVILPTDSERFNELRQVQNAAISHSPALIIRPKSVPQIQKAVKWAVNQQLPISVKAGGHSNTGYSVINNSVLIDLSELKSIKIDDATVQVETGCLWRDLYGALGPRGLLVAGGAEASVGVAGLTLGGGYSIFSPKYGLALDQVVRFEMVDARGELIIADQDTNNDLFWALRGAGHGSFGIVTQITFRTSELEYPKFYRCRIQFSTSELSNILKEYDAFHQGDVAVEKTAKLFIDVRAGTILLDLAYLGNPHENPKQHFEPFFKLPNGSVVFEGLQTMLEYSSPKKDDSLESLINSRAGSTKRGGFVKRIDDDAIQCLEKLISSAQRYCASVSSKSDATLFIYIDYWFGSVGKVHKSATAFYHRRKSFAQIILGSWATNLKEESILQTWVTDSFHQLSHQSDMFGGHVNTPTSGLTDWFRFYWKSNYERLREIKSKYDPEEVFRHPHSVRPRVQPQPQHPTEEEEEAPPSRYASSKL